MNPCKLVRDWCTLAKEKEVPKFNALCLSTVGRYGMPSSRMVLAERIVNTGVIFCTDSRSRKCREFVVNPQAAATFYWAQIHRQIRIEGRITPAADLFADEDFARKTATQQLLILICQQSEACERHWRLEKGLIERAQTQPQDIPITRPLHWKAYCLVADRIEFFLGGNHRLNKRLLLTRGENGWCTTHLFP